MRHLLLLLALPALLVLALSGCGSKPSGMPLGTVQLRLTDAPGDIQSVHLVIAEVSVHRSGGGDDDTTAVEAEDDTTEVEDPAEDDADEAGWEVVRDDTLTVDLMTLRNGVFTTLGIALVPAGHYTQIRLKLGAGSDVVVDGVTHPLVVPSGLQSGLKLIHPFTVPPEGFVDLLLDFDGQRSIVLTGAGTWMLRPTVKVIESSGSGRAAEAGARAGESHVLQRRELGRVVEAHQRAAARDPVLEGTDPALAEGAGERPGTAVGDDDHVVTMQLGATLKSFCINRSASRSAPSPSQLHT